MWFCFFEFFDVGIVGCVVVDVIGCYNEEIGVFVFVVFVF